MPTSLTNTAITFNDGSSMFTAAPGMIALFAANSIPAGWLKANGAAGLSTSTYANLFAVIGYTYGGSGSSFTLPDCRGYFPRSWDDGRAVDPSRVIGSVQADAMRNITGNIVGANTNAEAKMFLSGSGVFTVSNIISRTSIWENWTYTAYSRAAFAASNQVTTAAEFRPRNVALLACIKF